MKKQEVIRRRKFLCGSLTIVAVMCLFGLGKWASSTTQLFAKSSLSLSVKEDTIRENELFQLEVKDNQTIEDSKEETKERKMLTVTLPEGIDFDESIQDEVVSSASSDDEITHVSWDETDRYLTISMNGERTTLAIVLTAKKSGEYTIVGSDPTTKETQELAVTIHKGSAEKEERSGYNVTSPLSDTESEEGEVVKTSQEFVNAWNNPSVTKIIVDNGSSMDVTATLNARKDIDLYLRNRLSIRNSNVLVDGTLRVTGAEFSGGNRFQKNALDMPRIGNRRIEAKNIIFSNITYELSSGNGEVAQLIADTWTMINTVASIPQRTISDRDFFSVKEWNLYNSGHMSYHPDNHNGPHTLPINTFRKVPLIRIKNNKFLIGSANNNGRRLTNYGQLSLLFESGKLVYSSNPAFGETETSFIFDGIAPTMSTPVITHNRITYWNGRTRVHWFGDFETGIAEIDNPEEIPEQEVEKFKLVLENSPIRGGESSTDQSQLFLGERTRIKATPNTGYRFKQWELVSGVGARIEEVTKEETTFTMGLEDATVKAVYEQITHELSLEASPAEGGVPSAEETTVGQGSTTVLKANPNSGYRFSKWEVVSGSGTVVEEPTKEETKVTMGVENAKLRAVYERIYTLEIEASPSEGGTPSAAKTILAQGETTIIKANPARGYSFSKWEITSGTGTVIEEPTTEETTITMGTEDAKIRAIFLADPIDALKIESAPSRIDFGTLTYDATTKRIENPTIDSPLVVLDRRSGAISGWTLTATVSTPMKNEDEKELTRALRYVHNGKETILGMDAQIVGQNTTGTPGRYVISDHWGKEKGSDGLKLQLDSSDSVYTGNYIGVITWKLMAGQP